MTPLQAALDVLDRAESLLTLDSGTDDATLLEYDIRRQALAMGVAALDTWMHWSIRRADLNKLSNSLAQLEVPFEALVASGRRSVEARHQNIRDRPQVRARHTLNEKLLTMTFQNGRQWEKGFALLGIKSGLTRAGQAMAPTETRTAIMQRLDALSHRRNKIVHEGDLQRQFRPQQIWREELPRVDVEADLAWVRSFLTAVDTV